MREFAPLIVAEPRSAYARRPRLVVDANVIAATLFAESGADSGLAWMQGRKLCAPVLIDFEICNVAVHKGPQAAARCRNGGGTA